MSKKCCGDSLLDRGIQTQKSKQEIAAEKKLMRLAESKACGKVTGMIHIMFGEKGIIVGQHLEQRPTVMACYAAEQVIKESVRRIAAGQLHELIGSFDKK